MTIKRAPRRIAVLAYEGCLGTPIFGISDVLLIGENIGRAFGKVDFPVFEVDLIGLSGRSVKVAGGISVTVARPSGKYDLLVVPGMGLNRNEEWDNKLALLSRELSFIQKTFASGTTVASTCIGAFLLGEAGLLDGRKATTAWLFTQELAKRYPLALVDADAVLVTDGAIITTGAVSSTFDLAIHIVKQSLGTKIASATARVALLPNPRVSQAPYIDGAMVPTNLPSFSQHVTQWLTDRITETFDLEVVASAFHVSARTLLRRVKAETGKTPLSLLQIARVEKAKQLLASTNWSIARITEEIGYSDVATFSRLFSTQVGETPAMFRRRQAINVQ
jgi:transcriptional regulator GlxA family with amidase domain